jgi:hypothetical protein
MGIFAGGKPRNSVDQGGVKSPSSHFKATRPGRELRGDHPKRARALGRETRPETGPVSRKPSARDGRPGPRNQVGSGRRLCSVISTRQQLLPAGNAVCPGCAHRDPICCHRVRRQPAGSPRLLTHRMASDGRSDAPEVLAKHKVVGSTPVTRSRESKPSRGRRVGAQHLAESVVYQGSVTEQQLNDHVTAARSPGPRSAPCVQYGMP